LLAINIQPQEFFSGTLNDFNKFDWKRELCYNKKLTKNYIDTLKNLTYPVPYQWLLMLKENKLTRSLVTKTELYYYFSLKDQNYTAPTDEFASHKEIQKSLRLLRKAGFKFSIISLNKTVKYLNFIHTYSDTNTRYDIVLATRSAIKNWQDLHKEYFQFSSDTPLPVYAELQGWKSVTNYGELFQFVVQHQGASLINQLENINKFVFLYNEKEKSTIIYNTSAKMIHDYLNIDTNDVRKLQKKIVVREAVPISA
jgi:hypothetical protein